MKKSKSRSASGGRSKVENRKGKERPETGIREGIGFFVGGRWRLAGHMHYKPPRWTEEYERMEVVDLCERAKDDLAELFARAYPTSTDEWEQQFGRKRQVAFPLVTYEDRVRAYGGIGKSISESRNPGLNERLFSDNEKVSEQAQKEYEEIVERLVKEEPRAAVNVLAFIVTWAANYLENLAVKRPTLMKEVAKTRALWPVNLGLRTKVVKGKPSYQLTRSGFARDYLRALELNSKCTWPSSNESGAISVSPFKIAAEDLYMQMLMLNRYPRGCFAKVTPWAKRLFALSVPMTQSNTREWWNLAKVWLYERWDKAQEEFAPLVNHLGFKFPIEPSTRAPYKSNIKSRVIDNSLKDAFLALAQP